MNIKNVIYNKISILALATLFAVIMVLTLTSDVYVTYRSTIDNTKLKQEELAKKNELIKKIKNYNEVNKNLTDGEMKKIANLPPADNSADVYIGIIQDGDLISVSDYSFSSQQNLPSKTLKKESLNYSLASFSATGQFENFLNLLSNLETSLPIIEIEKISAHKVESLSNNKEDHGFISNPILNFDVDFKYYYR